MNKLIVFALAALPMAAQVWNPQASQYAGGWGQWSPTKMLFVNSSTGSDANTGTDKAKPLQTIAAATAKLTTRGQVLELACSSVFQGDPLVVPIAARSLVVQSPANCATNPMIDSSAAISSGAWTLFDAGSSTYSASVTIDKVLGYVRLWDGLGTGAATRITRFNASCTGVITTSGNYCPSVDPGGGGGTLTITVYLRTADDSNPGSNGHTYYINKYNKALAFDGTGTELQGWVYGIDAKRNLHNDGSLNTGAQSVLYNINLYDGTKHLMLSHEGTVEMKVSVGDHYYANGAANSTCTGAAGFTGCSSNANEIYDPTPSGKDHLWIDNGCNDSTTNCMYAHDSAAATHAGTIRVHGGTFTGSTCYSAFGYSQTFTAFLVENFTCNGTTAYTSGAPTTITNSVFTAVARNLQPTTGSTVTIRSSTINGTGTNQGTSGVIYAPVNNVTLDIQNSTIQATASAGTTTALIYFGSATGVSLTSLNNTFVNPNTAIHNQAAYTLLNSNGNTYSNKQTTNIFRYLASFYSLANWQTTCAGAGYTACDTTSTAP